MESRVKCSNCNEMLALYSSVDEMQSQMKIHCHCDCGVTNIVASRGTFVEYTPKLANTIYGGYEYKEYLEGMNVALKHHYEHYSHHPEHYNNGIDGMSLLDIIEMLCDWKAEVKDIMMVT